MKKILLILILTFLATAIFITTIYFFNKNSGKGALQVTSIPKSKVFLDGKLIGQTPLCKCESSDMLKVGEYTLRLIPEDGSFLSFENKIKISKSVLTVVDRTFGKGAMSDSIIINLDPLNDSKALELLIISFPADAQVSINNNFVKNTPVSIKNLTESDHELKISKNGYKEKIIKIRTVKGYKLTVLSFLGVDPSTLESSLNLQLDKQKQASPSAIPTLQRVTILETPTGFLRVRETDSINSKEIGRIYPEESYELIGEKENWFEIRLKDGNNGWINTRYAQKESD